MKTTEHRARAALVVLGIALVVLLLGVPIVWGGAVGVLAATLGDTSPNGGGWLLGAMGLLMVAAVVGLGALMAFGAWRH
jgi:hypothetical protein